MDISPDPTTEEAVAIAAALELAWPRPAGEAPPTAPPRWRFSGRWWSQPIPLRRTRPW